MDKFRDIPGHIVQHIKKERQKRELKRTRTFAVILGAASIIAIFFGIYAWQQRNEARKQREAVHQITYDANYKPAKVFEEKAMHALDSHDYKQAWLNMTAALKQEIPNDRLHLRPDSVGALLNREVTNAAFGEHWVSPSYSQLDAVTSVVFNLDGKNLASGSWDKTIRLWDIRTYKETATLTGYSPGVTCVAFSPDGKTLASGSLDKTIRLWDTQTQEKTVWRPSGL